MRALVPISFLGFLAIAAQALAVEPGQIVVIKGDAPLKISGKVVGQVKAGELHKIHAVRGAWVEVGEKTRGWVRTDNVTSQADAVAHVTKLLEEKPGDAGLLVTRARMYLTQEKLDAAEIDLKEAMRQDPANAEARYYLSEIERQRGRDAEMIARLNEAIELNGNEGKYFLIRARWHHRHGDLAAARKDLEQAAVLDAADAQAYNTLAWWYATDPDAMGRDGKKAVKYALKACELTHYNNYALVDTLAAAYAELGDWPNAIKWQEEAVDLCDDPSQVEQLRKRVDQYRLNTPYRETVR